MAAMTFSGLVNPREWCGVGQLAARWVHTPKVASSSLAPAISGNQAATAQATALSLRQSLLPSLTATAR